MRLVVIGCGGMGTYHMKKFSKLGATIVGAIDKDKSKLEKLGKIYPLEFALDNVEDLEKYRDRFDCISIAIVDSLHLVVAKKVSKYRVPIFMEKPFAYDLESTRDIESYMKSPLTINFSKRNFSGIYLLRDFLYKNEFGKIISIESSYIQSWIKSKCWGDYHLDNRWNWRVNPAISCYGVLGDLGSHVIDTLLLIFPDLKFNSILNSKELDEPLFDKIENHKIYTSIEFELEAKGIPVNVKLSYEGDSEDEFEIKVMCENGTLIFNNNLRDRLIYKNNEISKTFINSDEVISTYQQFMNLVDKKINNKIDLTQALIVQQMLDTVIVNDRRS